MFSKTRNPMWVRVPESSGTLCAYSFVGIRELIWVPGFPDSRVPGSQEPGIREFMQVHRFERTSIRKEFPEMGNPYGLRVPGFRNSEPYGGSGFQEPGTPIWVRVPKNPEPHRVLGSENPEPL